MNPTLPEKIHQALKKEGYGSLLSFYRENKFSFTYEYLRQIATGEKTPSRKTLDQICRTLQLDREQMQKLVAEAKLAKKIRQYYQLPPATQLGGFSEKILRYSAEGKKQAKLLRMIEKLGESEKEQAIEYLKFLSRKSRQKVKEKK